MHIIAGNKITSCENIINTAKIKNFILPFATKKADKHNDIGTNKPKKPNPTPNNRNVLCGLSS
jgi:hypothetical protein